MTVQERIDHPTEMAADIIVQLTELQDLQEQVQKAQAVFEAESSKGPQGVPLPPTAFRADALMLRSELLISHSKARSAMSLPRVADGHADAIA
jgi:hypothetical protein